MLKSGNYLLFYSDICKPDKEGPLFLKEQQAIISGLEQNKNEMVLKQFEVIKQTVKVSGEPISRIYRKCI